MKYSALVLVLIILVSSAAAFDGQRKGFVLGGGLGFSPVLYSKTDVFDYSETNAGVGLNLFLGYAWDEQNMLLYEGNVAGYQSNGYNNSTVVMGFDGISWYHYFDLPGQTFYSTIGLGTYNLQIEDGPDYDLGYGVMIGGGYEFSRHWQVGSYLGFGKTSYRGVKTKHIHLNILVSVVAF
ncbi:MAG: outer membrane beta-barrel protein [Candidatus Zixiibacteriota bacterium]